MFLCINAAARGAGTPGWWQVLDSNQRGRFADRFTGDSLGLLGNLPRGV
jgi:hypothetical protein